MRIAQVAPLFESVPPKLYGGTERVVSTLTEELVARGHDVTLFASGDSVTAATLVPCCKFALRLDPNCRDFLAPLILMLERVTKAAQNFDIVHFHTDYAHYPLSRLAGTRQVTTLHGRLDIPELAPLYREFSDMPVVSISNAQREPLPWINWQATVYHGLPKKQFRFNPLAGRYLAFLGRFSPEKRADRAIEIARRFAMPIRLAAKIDLADRGYYQSAIAPSLDGGCVEYIGEIDEARKSDFLGNAYALLCPVDWPEPFGLAMIEAMACGTPVIAYRRGSIPEVIEDGVTGFIVNSVEESVAALKRVAQLDRARIRREFERRYGAARMTDDYLRIYRKLTSPRSCAQTDHDG